MDDDEWFAQNRLFHYTKDIVRVVSILQHGFLLVPNRRGVIQQLLPAEDFSKREPQQFGMTSFTELPIHLANSHREDFGNFGICVTWDWAMRNAAHRAIYVDESGIVFDRLKWLFELARQQIDAQQGSMAITNKMIAMAMGAPLYQTMLTLYEYMQTSRDSSQVEWRIVNRLPTYYDLTDRDRLIAKLVADSKVSAMGVVPVSPADVEMIVCPASSAKAMERALPPEFQHVPVLPLSFGSTAAAAMVNVLRWLARYRRARSSAAKAPPEPLQAPEIVLKHVPGLAGVFGLPPAHTVSGAVLYANKVKARSRLAVQYQDEVGQWFELPMTVNSARSLLHWLTQALTDPRSSDSL